MRKTLIAVFICLLMSTMMAMADLVPTKVYIYGFSASFNDSTVYMTEIQEVDSAWVDTKTGFLYSRDSYSYQLRNYMHELGVPTPTCIVTFDKNRKKAEKKFMKLRKRYIENKETSYLVKYISTEDFKFEAISAAYDVEAQEAAKVDQKTRSKEKKEREKEMKKQRRLEKGGRPELPPGGKPADMPK